MTVNQLGIETKMNDWAVYRLDYNANEFVVERGLSKAAAEQLAEEYINKGHHQHYWVDKQPSEVPDHTKLMSDMIASGSSQEMAIKVLLSQGATHEQCAQAMALACKLTFDDCMAKVLEIDAG